MGVLKSFGVCSLAVDGWTDHGSFPTLAFTATTPCKKAFLIKFQRARERETGEFLSEEIGEVVESLKSQGIRVAGVVADNAKNIQKGIELIVVHKGLVKLNCFAHTVNLLLFKVQFDQAAQVEEFFANRHQPHLAYHSAKETFSGTKLLSACETRWASQVGLIGSVLKNRNVIEQAILQLRSQKYPFKGSELMWVWAQEWWATTEGLHNSLNPFQKFLEAVQSDGLSLGCAVDLVLPVLNGVVEGTFQQLVNLLLNDG